MLPGAAAPGTYAPGISSIFAPVPFRATSAVAEGLEGSTEEVKTMSRHAKLLSGILAAAFTLVLAPRVFADPPPWAGVWRHNKHVNDRVGSSGGYSGVDRGYDRCGPVLERIDYDRGLIGQWQNSGRHQKVVQWAHEDIAKARQDLYACRSETSLAPGAYAYDPYGRQPARSYDAGYPPQSGYGPYSQSDGGFDWNRDWPWLVGSMINGQLGR